MSGDVNKLVEGVSEKVLVCRIDRHVYDRRKSTVEMDGRIFVWGRTCSRCGTRRIQRLNSRGRILSNSYTYPKGYRVAGVGALDADSLGMIRLIVVGKGLA